MSIVINLLSDVLAAAKSHGMDQSSLAAKAGIRSETISRAKRRQSLDLESLIALASAAGLELQLRDAKSSAPISNPKHATRSPLADPKWGLAWSNPNISNEALVCNALRHGGFDHILQAVIGHGLFFVQDQWKNVSADMPPRSRAEVQRKLTNIEKGWNHASP